jgi:phosphoribosylanthranilate isomerase
VKICGITRLQDALLAVELGADALGFNFWPESKRYCAPERAAKIIAALPPLISTVGIFVNQSRAHIRRMAGLSGVRYVQLHGNETPEFCEELGFPHVKAVRVEGAESIRGLARYRAAAGFLLDAPSAGYGGSGKTFDWALARRAAKERPILLAGGLTPENVSQALTQVRPYGVDVASGVESKPGKKDKEKLSRFIRQVKEWKP